MRILGIMSCLLGTALLGGLVHAEAATTLYDGSLGPSPSAQGWLHPPLGGTQTVGSSFTTFDTTSNITIKNGYAESSPVTLDRTTGYTLTFDIGLVSESHTSNDRAGVSLIAIGSDLDGIELGFWGDRVFAQNSNFTHGEEGFIDTLSGIQQYDLTISGSSYQLSANGSSLLSGSLRDYSSHGLPYNDPNFLFLGDDTTEAKGAFQWSFASVGPAAVTVPEPGSATLLLGGATILLGALRIARRRR